jgi:hypothetical protein
MAFNMVNWFRRMIDKERWQASWNSVTELYALNIVSNAFDDSIMMQSAINPQWNSPFRAESKECENIQDGRNEEIKGKMSITDYVYLIQNHI